MRAEPASPRTSADDSKDETAKTTNTTAPTAALPTEEDLRTTMFYNSSKTEAPCLEATQAPNDHLPSATPSTAEMPILATPSSGAPAAQATENALAGSEIVTPDGMGPVSVRGERDALQPVLPCATKRVPLDLEHY